MPKAKPKAKRRRAPIEVVPTTPEAIFARIAEIMEIPDASRTEFVLEIKHAIDMGGRMFRRQQMRKGMPRDRRALRRIAEAAKQLHDFIKQPTPFVRMHLGAALDIATRNELCRQLECDPKSGPLRPFSEDDHATISKFRKLYDVDALLKWCGLAAEVGFYAASFGGYRSEARRGRRGRPKGAVSSLSKGFVRSLIWAANQYGGKATARRATGDGTLVEAQELCHLLLPKNFKLYSAATLEDIKDEEERAWKLRTNKSK